MTRETGLVEVVQPPLVDDPEDSRLRKEHSAAFDMGVEHAFFLKRGRRCSVPGNIIASWKVDDFNAYRLGVTS